MKPGSRSKGRGPLDGSSRVGSMAEDSAAAPDVDDPHAQEDRMADYDREDHEGGGGFMMGLLTGTVLGAGLGMLLAPKRGSELRTQIGEGASSLGRRASDMADRARESMNRGVDQIRGRSEAPAALGAGNASSVAGPASGGPASRAPGGPASPSTYTGVPGGPTSDVSGSTTDAGGLNRDRT
jgi:YtxH-like protein